MRRIVEIALALALLGAGAARAQDPVSVEKAGTPSAVKTNRASEQPYRMPPDTQIGLPKQPLHLDPKASPYLWVVDPEGRFVVAPENTADRERLLKHGDLAPAPDGLTRGPARIAGTLRWNKGEWVMDADSSYNYNRTDGTRYMRTTNLDAAFKLLQDTGTDVSRVRLDYHYLFAPGAASQGGIFGAITRTWILAKIAIDRVFAKVLALFHGNATRVEVTKDEPAKTDERGFERPASPGLTDVLERATAEDGSAER